MKRIMLKVAYDGTAYVGWQIQKNGLAVEEVLNSALKKLLNEDVFVIGASRTDSGVHARGNVAVFDTETKIPPEKIYLALNKVLPDDIKVTASFEVASDFHPRVARCVKTYRYSILNSRYPIPQFRLYADYVYYPLDIEKMRSAARYLIGEHDFTAFSTAGGKQRSPVRTIYSININSESVGLCAGRKQRSPVRTIYSINIDSEQASSYAKDVLKKANSDDAGNINFEPTSSYAKDVLKKANSDDASNIDFEPADPYTEEKLKKINSDDARNFDKDENKANFIRQNGEDCETGKIEGKAVDFTPQLIHIIVRGNGFLYNMVRIIAGTLEKVGMGVFPPEHVMEILDSKDRSKSSPKAAARGLELVEIEYI